MRDEDRRNRIVDIIDVVKDNVSDFLRIILNPSKVYLSKNGLEDKQSFLYFKIKG